MRPTTAQFIAHQQDNIKHYQTRHAKLYAEMTALKTLAERATVGHGAACQCNQCEIHSRILRALTNDFHTGMTLPRHN